MFPPIADVLDAFLFKVNISKFGWGVEGDARG